MNPPQAIDQNQSYGGNTGSAHSHAERATSRPSEAARTAGPELVEQIRARAYELFEQRGRREGFAQQDWAQAEAEVLARFKREKSA